MDPHLLPDVLVFLNVVRSGSITKAARQLNTVQSNVTARIKKLEEVLGVPLLSRHARGVRLTSGGDAVLPIALRLDALLNDLGYAFGRQMPLREAKLRLGAIETVAAVQLPRLVSQFLTKSPHVDISIQAGSSSRLVKQVKDGEVDAAFVSRAFRLPNFREELVFEDKLVVLVPRTIKTISELLRASRTGLKVMVIDDSSTIRRSAEIFLVQAGCQVILAEDGFDALAKINDYQPDLIFCDILMPRLDGYQTCSLIKKSARFSTTPAIVGHLSSSAMLPERSRMK